MGLFQLRLIALILALFVPAVLVAQRVVRRWVLSRFTGVLDVQGLGTPRKGERINGSVVICGGSIGGLLTARVLSDHFTRVVVIEPEAWALSDDAAAAPAFGTREVTSNVGNYTTISHNRSRVYQYTAVHAYQVLFTQVVRALFPGSDALFAQRGIRLERCDMAFRFSGWGIRPPYREYGGKLPEMVCASRRTLEAALRALVRSTIPGVEYVHGTAKEFVLDPGSLRINAVRVREGDTERDIACLMAIDCTGVAQVGLKLLDRALPGRSHTELMNLREEYDPQVNYVTMEMPLPPRFESEISQRQVERGLFGPDWTGPANETVAESPWWVVFIPDPSVDYRSVSVGRCERGLVFVLGGWASETPISLDQVREYAMGAQSDFPVPQMFFDIVDLCEPIKHEATVTVSKTDSCSRIKYENAAHFLPRNFIALGDASMRLNPRFGEGVTKVALGVATLDGVLRRCRGTDIGPTFFRSMAQRTQSLWDLTRYTDYGRATTKPVAGEKLSDGAFQRWFTLRLNRVMARDDAASSAVWHNMNFLAPPLDVYAPSIVLKVLWEAVFPTEPLANANNSTRSNSKVKI